MGVPPVLIVIYRWDVPFKTIQLSGYPHFRKPPYNNILSILWHIRPLCLALAHDIPSHPGCFKNSRQIQCLFPLLGLINHSICSAWEPEGNHQTWCLPHTAVQLSPMGHHFRARAKVDGRIITHRRR